MTETFPTLVIEAKPVALNRTLSAAESVILPFEARIDPLT